MKSFAFAAALIAGANASWGGWNNYQAPAQKSYGGAYGQAASKQGAGQYGSQWGSDYDEFGRDQDLDDEVQYSKTSAKKYGAESYDEWDNVDNDRYGAQTWGQDRDAYGSSSYGNAASNYKGNQGQYGYGNTGYGHGHGHGYGNKGYGAGNQWAGASGSYGAAKGAYDNDVWAKQAGGQDYDSRWGKSYDSVNAASYDNEEYGRKLRANDDVWAVDYDQYKGKDAYGYGKAASNQYGAYGNNNGYGNYGGWGGYGNKGYGSAAGYGAAASKAGAGKYGVRSGSDFDQFGRDRDVKLDERYSNTSAKKYGAESYDEWDNKDNDRWGAQAWGKDRDVYGASSYGKAASDYDRQGQYGNYGGYGGYGNKGYGGHGHGYGGYGKNVGYGNQYGNGGASASYGAQQAGYDNDVWAKNAGGADYDSRWGKSYDSVDAASYDNEEYGRKLKANDDVWAVDYDQYDNKDAGAYGAAASKQYGGYQQSYKPAAKPSYGGWGNYGGYGNNNNYGNYGW